MNIIGRRKLWYMLSSVLLIPGVVALLLFDLRLGIDFTGGTVIEVSGISTEQARELATEAEISNLDSRTTDRGLLLRYRPQPEVGTDIDHEFRQLLEENNANILRFDVVGPSVSSDITRNAALAILVMSLAIVVYIAWSFRNMPPPVRAVVFGLVAVLALLHDSLFVLGAYAILGEVAGIEVDAYFVTAILTVIGFSVHDTIVVFDRIREDLQRYSGKFSELVNRSINEVMVRSLNTSFVIMLVLLALFLFGGESTRYFVLALLLGMAAGTYSSIFLASPLLVSWQKWQEKRAK